MRALVTGGGGFLGRHLAQRLQGRGDEVTILGRRDYPDLGRGTRALKVDLCDHNSAVAACAGQDVVFHAAARPGIWGEKSQFYGSNVDATQHIIEGCKKHKVQKLIFTSSPSVVFGHSGLKNADETQPYPEDYTCEYPRTKAIAERMVIKANDSNGLLTVSLRPHLIWGPGDPHLVPRIVHRAREGKLVQVGEGENQVDIIYIDNAVEAHIRACDVLEKSSAVAGRCYFVSDGQPVVLWDWINNLLAELGIPRVTRKISHRAGYNLGFLLEVIYRVLGWSEEPRITRFLADQLANSHYFNISRAREDFKYKPIVGPEEGLIRLIKYLKSHPVN